MTDRPKTHLDKFKEAARELGVELDEEKLKEALRKIAPDRPFGDAKQAGGKHQRGR